MSFVTLWVKVRSRRNRADVSTKTYMDTTIEYQYPPVTMA